MRIIAPEGKAGRILAETELAELLKNPNVTAIDGIPKIQLVEHRAVHGDDALRKLVFGHSHIKVYLSGLAAGDLDKCLNFPPPERYVEVLKDPQQFNLSHDAVADERKGLIYKMRVAMEQSMINVNGTQLALSPGMTVAVESKTGTRKMIEFFLSPLLRYANESARER